MSSERHGWLVCHETIDMFWHVCYGVRGRVVTFENCAIPGQIGGSTRAWRTTRMAAFPGMMTTSTSSRVSQFMTPYRDSISCKRGRKYLSDYLAQRLRMALLFFRSTTCQRRCDSAKQALQTGISSRTRGSAALATEAGAR